MKLQIQILIVFFYLLSSSTYSKSPFTPISMNHTSSNNFSIYIMDYGRSSIEDLQNMLTFYNPDIDNDLAGEIARTYIEECMDEGVNHDIAFCQMILETGFLKYGGSVHKSQNNFCGLGATSSQSSGESFPDMRTGVRAHIQHLKAYGSQDDLNKEKVDNRFRFVKRGSARTVFALQGRWAMDPLYDHKLENLLQRLFSLRYLFALDEELSSIQY